MSAAFLAADGYPLTLLRRASDLARRNGTTAAAELLAHGAITADAYYRALARHLGVAFRETGEIASVVPTVASGQERPVLPSAHAPSAHCTFRDGGMALVSAPDTRLVALLQHLSGRAMLADRMAITTPDSLRRAIERQYGPAILERAITGLAFEQPAMSARSGALFWQGVATSVLMGAAALLFLADQALAVLASHIFLSLFFLGCVLVRLAALADYRPRRYRPLEAVRPDKLPVYSVIVCLYREAPVVADLIGSLKRLNWPRSKLEVLLACEADDRETIDAIEAAGLLPHMRIVRIPPALPRTKPKALNLAFAQTRGSLVTVYDAEDRPHPDQLLEAFQAFSRQGSRLACLQAPLVTANPGRNAIAALFHLEYAGLFHGLLPYLARHGFPLLLGGTSNHFRADSLREIGGWDPFNVTEDADLGMRFWRKGYRCGVLTRPTLEDAPHEARVWLRQRTRWHKGWIQTWLVHARHPLEVIRRHGIRQFAVMQVLLAGTLVSALLHPAIIVHAVMLGLGLLGVSANAPLAAGLAVLDLALIALSYLAFASLGWRAAGPRGRRAVRWRLLLVPLYWLALSLAAWRAVFEFFDNPHGWNKTPHTPHQKR